MFNNNIIAILGYNEALGRELIKSLITKNVKLHVFDERKHGEKQVKDTLNRVSYFNIDAEESINLIDKAGIIINLLFTPTPKTFDKIHDNIARYKKIIYKISLDKKVVDVIPFINDNFKHFSYKTIYKLSKYTQDSSSEYFMIKVPAILSNYDSLIQDIESLYNLSGKMLAYKENFSYVDKALIIKAIQRIVLTTTVESKSIELGSYKSINISDLNLVIFNENNEGVGDIIYISKFYKNVLCFLFKKKLYSFNRRYLHFLRASKKSSINSFNANSLNIIFISFVLSIYRYKSKTISLNSNNEETDIDDLAT